MKKHFADFKAGKERILKKKAELDCRAIEPLFYYSKESKGVSIFSDEEAYMEAAIQVSLYEQR